MHVLTNFFLNTLGLQEGEIRKTLLMQVNIFLIICASLIIKPIANGLFLAKFGVERLPVAFVLVALAAGAVSFLYTRVLRRYSVVGIFRWTFNIAILSILVFGVALRLNVWEGPVLYLLYIWIAIFALVSASQFWIVANFVFSAQEAKRLFGLLGAGAIAGAIFGGYLTSILASFLNSEYLLFLCALLLAICIPITLHVWKEHVDGVRSRYEKDKPAALVATHPFRIIRRSRQLSFMAAIAFVGVLVAKLVDYQFADLAVAAIDDPDALTAFFGFWFSTFNVISLLLQLFVTRKVVGTYGVGTALFFLPGFILLAAGFLLIFPELLFAAVFLKLTESSLKQSINRAGMELLILPIPLQIKNQTKTFIDVFVDSIATGCAGLLLFFVIQGLDLPGWVVTALIILFGIVWLRLSHHVRREYIRLFSRRIEEAKGGSQKRIKDPFDFSRASVLEGLRKVLRVGNSPQICYVLGKLTELKEGRLYTEAEDLLSHEDPAVVVEVLKYLGAFRRDSVALIQRIEPLIHSPSQEVKIQAFEYLIRHARDQRNFMMQKYLNDSDYRVRLAAMVSLAATAQTDRELRQAFGLDQLIEDRYRRLAAVTDPAEHRARLQGVLLAMGYARIPAFFSVIAGYFSHPDRDIYTGAFNAAGKTADPYFIGDLLRFLADAERKEAAAAAIAEYGIGVVPALREYAGQADGELQVLKRLPSVAARIPGHASIDLCFELLAQEDAETRSEAIKALSVLKHQFPDYKVDKSRTVNEIRREARLCQDTLSILYTQIRTIEQEATDEQQGPVYLARQELIALLEKKLDADLETLFQLLGLHYATDEIHSVYHVLKGDAREMRADALEFLDNVIEPHLKRVLLPILEIAAWESITEDAILKLKIHAAEEGDCYRMILEGRNRRLKLAVLHLFRQLHNPEYSILIDLATHDRDIKVRDAAIRTWEVIAGDAHQ